MNDVTRRSFLDRILYGTTGMTLLALVAPALSYLQPVIRKRSFVTRVEVGSLSDLPLWGARRIGVGHEPVNVVHTRSGVVAFSAICTHLGCVVNWDRDHRRFACPCHASLFDSRGQVISGPPPEPLRRYEVQVVADTIFVESV